MDHGCACGQKLRCSRSGTKRRRRGLGGENEENVTRAKHFDLLLLFRIIDGEFAGLYPMSDERAHVAEFLLTGELPDDHVKTGDEDEKSSIQNEKEGSVASGGGHVTRVPVMQQLSEATRRVQQLEEELAVIEERWSNEYKTNQVVFDV